MKRLKAIIFAFDYTLGNSTNGIVLSVNRKVCLREAWFYEKRQGRKKEYNWAVVKRYIFSINEEE